MKKIVLILSLLIAGRVYGEVMPEATVRVLPGEVGWFDAYSVMWADEPYAPYSLDIVNSDGISIMKNQNEEIDFSVSLVEFQETEESPSYHNSQLVITLSMLEYEIGASYTLTIADGTVNIILSDGEKVANEVVTYTFKLKEDSSLTLPEPNVSPAPGDVESLSEVEISWTGVLGMLDLLNLNSNYVPETGVASIYLSIDGEYSGSLDATFSWSSREAMTSGAAGDLLIISIPNDLTAGSLAEIIVREGYLQISDIETGTLYNDEIILSYNITGGNGSGNPGSGNEGEDPGEIGILNWGNVAVLPDSYAHWIGKDGILAVGEAPSAESSWGYDISSGDIFYYEAASIGDGNCISQNGLVVGIDKVYMKGAFLLPNADPVIPESLLPYSTSSIDAITWDGSRLCGYIENPRQGNFDEYDPDEQTMQYLPFYCDINGNEISEVKLLPTPPRDFFNLVPQYCTAKWISDDGKTILGQVIDNSGYYIYPIVYQEDSEGKWSYTLPSEKLFNQEGLQLPVWPIPEMKSPLAQDFIGDEELRQYFLELLEEWNGDEDGDPYQLLEPTEGQFSLMTPEEWTEYQKAIREYMDYSNNIYEPLVEKYYEEFSYVISKSCNFLQTSMSLNPQGTKFSQTRVITRIAGDGNPVTYEIPYLFTLGEEEPKIYGDEFSELRITQILSDGTILAATPKPGSTTPDATPQHSYVLPSGAEEFIPLEEYVRQINSGYADWMQSYLYHNIPIGYDENGQLISIDLTITGLATASDDFSVIAAGIDTDWWDIDNNYFYYSYFLTDLWNDQAGVKDIKEAEINSQYGPVYNLQGVKVKDLQGGDTLETLPKGIYILNGRKIFVGK